MPADSRASAVLSAALPRLAGTSVRASLDASDELTPAAAREGEGDSVRVRGVADGDQLPRRRDLYAAAAIAGSALLPLPSVRLSPSHCILQVLIKSICPE